MSIRDFVMAQPLFDAHEHLMPISEFKTPEVWTLTKVTSYAFGDLVTSCGADVLNEKMPEPGDAEYLDFFFDAWGNCRNTGYCRAAEAAIRDLFGMNFTRETWPELRTAILDQIAADPQACYNDTMQKKANIRWSITDAINHPDQAADGMYPDFVRFNYRDDELLAISDRLAVEQIEARWNSSIHSLDELVAMLNHSIDECLATGKVTCFKIGQAYKRNLDFGNATHAEAERLFNDIMQNRSRESFRIESGLSPVRLKPLHDYLGHQYIRRATDEGLPIQIHTGYLAANWGDLNNIDPMPLANIIRQYRRTRFDIFHSSWPHQEMLAAMAKHYPNVWVNMCWSWAMNPSGMERALDTFLDTVPHNKIFAFGADTNTPFMAYGYAKQAREGIARVLESKVKRGDMDEALAERVARKIMLENGEEFHGLV